MRTASGCQPYLKRDERNYVNALTMDDVATANVIIAEFE